MQQVTVPCHAKAVALGCQWMKAAQKGGREALHHPTPTTRAGYWVVLRDFKWISIQGWLMMKWCRSFKMKTSKIKWFWGHHERQGCIQSPVHKNKKHEQRLEDLDGLTLLLQQPKSPVLENYDTIPSAALSNHLVFQLLWARPKVVSIAAVSVQHHHLQEISRFVNPIYLSGYPNLNWHDGRCQHFRSIGNSVKSTQAVF